MAWPYISPEPYICTTTKLCDVALCGADESVLSQVRETGLAEPGCRDNASAARSG